MDAIGWERLELGLALFTAVSAGLVLTGGILSVFDLRPEVPDPGRGETAPEDAPTVIRGHRPHPALRGEGSCR